MKINVRLGLILCGMVHLAAQGQTPAPLSAEALQQDLRFMQAAVSATHPDPGLFASPEDMRKMTLKVEGELQAPLTRDQAWRVLAQFNPVFADAHMLVSQADWAAQAQAHLAGGGGLFPFEVQVDGAGGMTIRSALDGVPGAFAGRRIEQVNGVPAARIGRELLALVSGDSLELRAHLLSRRTWFYYWKLYGAPPRFEIALAGPGRRTLSVPASRATPVALARATAPAFDDTFRFERVGKDAGLLTINQFMWPDQAAFRAFTKAVFTTLRDERIGTLLIDIRANTGGNDDMWKHDLLPYVADKPYRNGSSYIKKVIAGRASGSERVGDVVHGFIDGWVQPELANPLRYAGKVYVLVGRTTYSSAVLFSNVVQDFGFAQLVGAGGYAHTRQSGGVQNILLPNSGLEVSIPRFVLDRPSGARDPALVRPDIVLPDSPLKPRQLVDALLKRIAAGGTAATRLR